ncbi:MAG: hypothetical protein WCP77_03955 [Roseococcus sp.]
MGEPITARNGGLALTPVWANGLNCYSFAAQEAAPGGAGAISCVPGARGGAPLTSAIITKALLHQACVADGFEDVSGGVLGSDYKFRNPPVCDANSYLVAVFYDTRHSFHFARQLADGSARARDWVHKPSAAQNAHNMQGGYWLGSNISNVPWGPHFEFVSYLKAPNAGVRVNKGNF